MKPCQDYAKLFSAYTGYKRSLYQCVCVCICRYLAKSRPCIGNYHCGVGTLVQPGRLGGIEGCWTRVPIIRTTMMVLFSLAAESAVHVNHYVQIVEAMYAIRCHIGRISNTLPMKFHAKFWIHTPKNMHFTRCWKFDDLWYLNLPTLNQTS